MTKEEAKILVVSQGVQESLISLVLKVEKLQELLVKPKEKLASVSGQNP